MVDIARLIVDLDLKGDFTQGIGRARRGLRDFDTQVRRTTDGGLGRLRSSLRSPELRSSLLQGVGLGGGLLGFQALTIGIGKTIDILGDAARAAAEEEAAIAQLTRAIQENDEAWDGNIDAVEELIQKRQDLAFADSEQREGLRLLVAATKDSEEAQRLLGTAMDFARLRGINLKTSADLIGRAFQGNFQTLSRYGVVLRRGATAQEALSELQRIAEGQAEAYAETTQGKLVRAQIAAGDAMEDLGRLITPVTDSLADLAIEVLPQVGAAFANVGAFASFFATEVGKLQQPLQDAQEAAQDFAQPLNDLVGRDLTNDAANAFRILSTGGIILIPDAFGKATEAVRDFNETAEDLTDIGFVEFEDGFISTSVATARLADDLEDATSTTATFGRGLSALRGRLEDVAEGVRDDAEAFDEFQEAASRIASVQGIGAINRQLEKQRDIRRKAAREGDVQRFAAAEAAIAQLKEERALLRQGRQALRDFNRRTRRQKAGNKEVVDSLGDVRAAAQRVDRVDPTISVSTPGLAAATERLGTLSDLLGGFGGNLSAAFSGTARQHSGGIAQAGVPNVIRNDEALLLAGGDTRVLSPNETGRRFGGNGMSITLKAPDVIVPAAQIVGGTGRVIRTGRQRAMVA